MRREVRPYIETILGISEVIRLPRLVRVVRLSLHSIRHSQLPPITEYVLVCGAIAIYIFASKGSAETVNRAWWQMS
jgi:hypothetical protein